MNNINHYPLSNASDSKLFYVWLAGFIDGEGYIGITFQRKKETNQSSPTPRYHPYLIITSTSKLVIEFIQNNLKFGKVYKQVKREGNYKASYQYKLSSLSYLQQVLLCLLPYLVIKKPQAEIVLSYISRRQLSIKRTGRGFRGSTSFNSFDEEDYLRLLNLNKRGLL